MADDTRAQAPARGWRLVVLAGFVGFTLTFCSVPFPSAHPAMGVGLRIHRHTIFLSAMVATLTAAVAAPLLSRNLRLENQRMRGAINNMSQGLCMFDGNERLVVCNRRYMQMYNLSADIVTPRSTLHSLLEYRMRKVRRTAPPSASKRGTSAALRTS